MIHIQTTRTIYKMHSEYMIQFVELFDNIICVWKEKYIPEKRGMGTGYKSLPGRDFCDNCGKTKAEHRNFQICLE